MAEKLRVNINGVEQGMFIKGTNRSNPVLLWVHGGPGLPDYFLAEQYPAGLEDLSPSCGGTSAALGSPTIPTSHPPP
jgi:hypothetical protein